MSFIRHSGCDLGGIICVPSDCFLGLVWRWGQGGLSREEDVWKEDEKAQETSEVFEYAPIIDTVLGSILGVTRVNKSGA